MSKVTYRVPTKEQYGFIEVSVEETVSTDVIKDKFDRLYSIMNGYSDNDFLGDLVVIIKNNLRIEGEDAIGEYEQFTEKQKLVLKEIKLLVQRAISKYKPEK